MTFSPKNWTALLGAGQVHQLLAEIYENVRQSTSHRARLLVIRLGGKKLDRLPEPLLGMELNLPKINPYLISGGLNFLIPIRTSVRLDGERGIVRRLANGNFYANHGVIVQVEAAVNSVDSWWHETTHLVFQVPECK